jgi:predicted nuclease of predicted toxin-antitoxin system
VRLLFDNNLSSRLVWLRIGNCSTMEIEQLLRRSQATILAFDAEAATGLLTLIGR